MKNLTDEELYDLFLNGDNRAFEEIATRYHYKLTYFINQYTKNIATAEDLAQDVFVYILSNPSYFNPKFKLKTYLYTIAKSRTINYIKRESNNLKFEDLNEMCIDDFDLTEYIINKEKLKNIYRIMQELKPEYKSVIYLSEFEGFSTDEISKILNITFIQTKTLLYNARKKFKNLLEKEGINYNE